MRNLRGVLVLLAANLALGQTVPNYEVFEHTIEHTSGGYDNVWEEVTVAVQLISPSGKEFSIGGFYYDENTWKFRFTPNEIGTWTWTYNINGTEETSGSFEVTESDHPGFMSINPHNPRRWVLDNGKPIYLFGLQDCLEFTKYDFNMLGHGNYRVNDKKDLTAEEYFQTFRDLGFNLWRLNNGNCSMKMTGDLRVSADGGNSHSVENGKLMDSYAELLRDLGYRIYFPLFGMDLPWMRVRDTVATPEQLASINRFLTYAVNRYSAYVDIWELGNEVMSKEYSDSILALMETHLRSKIPHKPAYISMSWERPELDFLDIISPHSYTSHGPDRFPRSYVKEAEKWKDLNKPIMYGEAGNGTCSFDTLYNSFRWRVNIWSMFFIESVPIFWHQWNRTYCANASNIYFDSTLQDYFRYYTNWREDFDSTANKVDVGASVDDIHVFAQSGHKNYALYIYDNIGYENIRSGLTVTINPKGAAAGFWFDPKTGIEVAPLELENGGEQTVVVPDFQADIALKLTMEGFTSTQDTKNGGLPENRDNQTISVYQRSGKTVLKLPSSGSLSADNPNQAGYAYQIFSVSGRTVGHGTATKTIVLDPSEFSGGHYLLQLFDSSNRRIGGPVGFTVLSFQ